MVTTCEECGNDEPVEGQRLCPECLVGDIPEDWLVLWCPQCLTSISFALADAESYGDEEVQAILAWASRDAHPVPHFLEN